MPASSRGLGGWTINLYHSYDGKSGYLHEGQGRDRKIAPVGYAECSFSITNTPPTNEFAAVATDGSEYYVLDPDGRHLRTVDALTGADIYTFVYDTNNLLTEVVDANSLTTTLVRMTNGQVTAIIGPFGLKTDLVVSNEWLAGLVNPAGETNLFRYSESGLLTNIVSRRGFVYAVTYDAEGKAMRAEDPAGGFDAVTLANVYNRKSIVHTYSLNRTNVYNSSTDWNGDRVDEAINSAGAVTRTRTSSDGLTSEVTSPNGMVTLTRSVADPRFGSSVMVETQIVVRTPAGLTNDIRIGRSYSLLVPTNPASQLLSFTNWITVNGRTSQVVFSSIDRTLQSVSPMGKTSAVEFDSQWRPVQWNMPGIIPVTVDYDVYGRMSKIQQSNRVVHLAYATNGFRAAFTNALDESVLLRGDAIGRVTNVVLPDSSVIGLRPQPTTAPIGVTPPGRTEHTLGYTAVGLLDRYSSPSVGGPTNMLMTWDEARHLTSISYPDGRVITNEYNQAGFLVGVQWPENKVTNVYDCACGRLGGIYATNGASLIFGYDGGLLTNLTQSGVITGRMSYSYNNDFRVAGIGFGGNVAAYNYDADGLLTNAGGMRLYRDAASGWLTNAVVGDISDRRQYNGFGEMSSYEAVFDNDYVYYGVDYSYDKLGRITNRMERIEGATNNYAYVYDSVGRLHEVYTNGSLRARYWYDANGNRTGSWVMGQTRQWTYNEQDQLTSYSGVTNYFHANGWLNFSVDEFSTNSGDTITYDYDLRGSLAFVGLPDGTDIEYLLDPLGRRIGKKVNGQFERGWIYQSFLRPIAELNADGSLRARFVYATRVNVPDFMQTTGNVYRIITDHLGSVRLVIEVDSGEVVQRLDYDEWGNVLQDTNPGFQPFGFAGGLYDPDTGLTRFGYRDYDPMTGRWLAKDPILFRGGWNLYAYCYGDPINYIDPWGLYTCEELQTALGLAQEGQAIAMQVAQQGVPPSQVGGYQAGNPASGHPDPVINEFEKSIGESILGGFAHLMGQIANKVDDAVLDQPGNKWNYWGMIEVWRHQRLIDWILDQMKDQGCGKKPDPDPPQK
ncbi:MAG: RHS repeat-associated core domain-containing protein [Kiritimatiellae bacterium]|nr:RHS repeat-associated core domain-containing protein [Kiritimatiellia bacterium]